MAENLWRELWILIGVAALSLLLAQISGSPFLSAMLGFGLYIALELRNLVRLNQWLVGKHAEVPEAGGLWGEVFDRIRALMRETGQREDRLTEMVTRFQNASGATPDGMLTVSNQHIIEWANPAAGQLLGIVMPRDTGQRLFNLVRDPGFIAFLERGEYRDAYAMRSPAVPEKSLSIRIVPFGAHQKLIIARDTTQLMQLEQMRRNFVANISHELRTPLTVLTGFLETFKNMERPATGPDLGKHFQTMYEQSQRMARLVDDLLTLSKLETTPAALHEQVVDVPAMLASLREMGELLSAGHHHLSLAADSGLRVSGNEEELRSAFSNLINNAVRYTPAGGDIRLTWGLDGDQPVFAVTDSGEGIAPQHLPHLTERFYRVDTARSRDSGGTGLGLSIVKHILLRHDARLTIDSELGLGSTFRCIFPAARAVREPAVQRA